MRTSTAAAGASARAKRDILAKIPLFRDAPPSLQSALIAESTVVHLRAGDYFLREGDSCGQFAVVVSGRMRVFKLAESGHEITLYHVGAGEVCPLNVSCILSSRPVPAMAQVEEDVEAVVVPAASFRRWISEHEPLRTYVFQMFTSRLAEVMSLVEEIAFRRMDERLARRLEDLLVERRASAEGVEITHAEIASDLGTAREVVSRLLKELERLGAVRLSRGRIMLRDPALLHRMAEGRAG